MCDKIDCKYNRWLNSSHHERACHYCLDNKISRGCDAKDCNVYKSLNTEEKDELTKQRIRGGMTVLRENIKQDVWHDSSQITT